ncbi:MAG: TonB-dependent receptor plug [Mucilaginibacter sp.]|nr:TonB-dependent receptor plug [Mucilaginibacter sp.]
MRINITPKTTDVDSNRISIPPAWFWRLCLLPGILFFLCSYPVFAQTIAVSGIVKDAKGPLPGVTVKVKGEITTATTDNGGKFTISAPGNQSVLVFSFIGYMSREVTIGAKTTVDITLLENTSSLDEVVVIGYGQQKVKDITGSVGIVNVKDLQKAPVKSIDDALAGRVAGLQVVSSDGQPGSNAVINIRGVGSVTQSSAPLYVIDGFPQEDANFNSINPAEVASIEVLKDASATAIYGARGSNGVIIITTKRGSSSAPQISYDGYFGGQKPTKVMQLLSPYEFVRLQNDINPYYANAYYFTNGKTLEDYKNVQGIDWQKLVFNSTPVFQNHYISVSARKDKTAYTISGSYNNQEGLIINSGFKRYQGRFTLDQDITKAIKVGVNVNYAKTNSSGQIPSVQNVPTGSVVNSSNFNFIASLWTYRPVLGSNTNINPDDYANNQVLDNDPNNGGVANNRVNPYIGTLNEVNERNLSTLAPNGYVNVTFLKDFVLRVTAGATIQNGENYQFHNSFTNSGSPLTAFGQTYGVNGSRNNTYNYSFLNENTLTYHKAINRDNNITALVGFTTQTNKVSSYGFAATNIANESLGINGLGSGTPYTVSSGASSSAMQSFLGRVNYSLMDKYLLTASFRADGSSKFAPGNRWGYFPSGAFAWRISQEKFMKKLTWIDNAKLRLSYGATGNNRVTDFAYLSQLTANAGSVFSTSYYSFNENNVYNQVVSTTANANLKWETGVQSDAGLDLDLFGSRVSLVVDYYKKVTSNLLLNAALPYSTGLSNAFVNLGKVSNRGFEFTLNTVNVQTKQFSWQTSFNISFNKNRLDALNNGSQSLQTVRAFDANLANIPNYIAIVGQPVAQFYGYKSAGLYQLNDFYKIPNGQTGFYYVLKEGIPYYGTKNSITNPNTNPANSPQPGDPKYVDLNGDGVIDAKDYTTIGNPYPVHFGGLSNSFSYKGFDLSVFLQWSYGNQILDANRIKMEGGTNVPQSGSNPAVNQGMVDVNQWATYANRWTPTNPSNLYPRANAGGTRFYSDRVVEDGSYIRLKTIQLGYTIPPRLLARWSITSIRVYASAQNLWTLTGYTGPDPEVSTYSDNNLTPGFDFSPYPRTKVVTLGAKITL